MPSDDSVKADELRLVICRDIPGDHPGGPDCWCIPYVVDPFDDVAWERMKEITRHPERQIDG